MSDVRLHRSLRVISSDDIAFKPDSHSVVTLTTGKSKQIDLFTRFQKEFLSNYLTILYAGNKTTEEEEICMPLSNFIGGLVVIRIVLMGSCIMTALLCVKIRSITIGTKNIFP
jgi:hypothetical protein